MRLHDALVNPVAVMSAESFTRTSAGTTVLTRPARSAPIVHGARAASRWQQEVALVLPLVLSAAKR
jgi:hypothetical protein